MHIPAVYAVFKGGEVKAASARINGTDISFDSEPTRFAYSADETEDRMPIVAVDVKGLGKRRIDDHFLANIRFPGNDVWLLTHIEDIEDVFDCFMGEIVKLLMPYHTVRNGLVMKEAFDMSENCIPVLFVSQGRAKCRDRTEDIRTAMEGLTKTGFQEIAVLDTDSMLTTDDWASLKGSFPGLIPFIRNKDGMAGNADFRKIIYDL